MKPYKPLYFRHSTADIDIGYESVCRTEQDRTILYFYKYMEMSAA